MLCTIRAKRKRMVIVELRFLGLSSRVFITDQILSHKIDSWHSEMCVFAIFSFSFNSIFSLFFFFFFLNRCRLARILPLPANGQPLYFKKDSLSRYSFLCSDESDWFCPHPLYTRDFFFLTLTFFFFLHVQQ